MCYENRTNPLASDSARGERRRQKLAGLANAARAVLSPSVGGTGA